MRTICSLSLSVMLALLVAPVLAQDDSDVDAVVEMEVFGRKMAPTQFSFILRTDPDFEQVMLRQTYASQILNPIDKEEFERDLGSNRRIDNPLLWLTTGAGLASGITAGYMDSNGETANAGWLAGTAGVALIAATILMLID